MVFHCFIFNFPHHLHCCNPHMLLPKRLHYLNNRVKFSPTLITSWFIRMSFTVIKFSYCKGKKLNLLAVSGPNWMYASWLYAGLGQHTRLGTCSAQFMLSALKHQHSKRMVSEEEKKEKSRIGSFPLRNQHGGEKWNKCKFLRAVLFLSEIFISV